MINVRTTVQIMLALLLTYRLPTNIVSGRAVMQYITGCFITDEIILVFHLDLKHPMKLKF